MFLYEKLNNLLNWASQITDDTQVSKSQNYSFSISNPLKPMLSKELFITCLWLDIGLDSNVFLKSVEIV